MASTQRAQDAILKQGRAKLAKAPRTTADLKTINRVVCRHGWNTLSEWVTTLDELADLNDAEIEAVAGRAWPQQGSGIRH